MLRVACVLSLLIGTIACVKTTGDDSPTAPTPTVTNPLVGQWVLAATTNTGNPSGIGTRTKAFTETEWVIDQPNPATGAVVFHHGGHYTLRGTEYSETVEFANPSTASLIGRTFTATVIAEGNRFTQSSSNGSEEWSRVSQ